MIEKSMTIELPQGLEARPVAMLVQVASRYDSSIYLKVDERKVNAKSIMGMMTLGLDSGEEVTVIADGQDETEALADIENYLSNQRHEAV